jgi:hypothetical protein
MKLVRAVSIIRRYLLCKYGSRAGPPKAEPYLAKVSVRLVIEVGRFG